MADNLALLLPADISRAVLEHAKAIRSLPYHPTTCSAASHIRATAHAAQQALQHTNSFRALPDSATHALARLAAWALWSMNKHYQPLNPDTKDPIND